MTNKTQKKFAVFDLDGTLIDSKSKVYADIRTAYQRLGHTITEDESKGDWKELMQKYHVSEKEFTNAYLQRQGWEEAIKQRKVNLFPETEKILQQIKEKGTYLILLSKACPESTQIKLDELQLRQFFVEVYTADPRIEGKTSKLKEIMENIPLEYTEGVFIGDKIEDVALANEVNQGNYSRTAKGILVRPHTQTTEYPSLNSLDGLLEEF